MSVGKRHSTAEPLTEHDVADRLEKAMRRVWWIMLDIRRAEGGTESYPTLMDAVKHSRYLTNVPQALMWEMQQWGIEPHRAGTETEEQ